MAWYSLLPPHMAVYETWICRAFIVLAILNILPWTLVFTYDFLLYLYRTVSHEIPVYGGRAQGFERPRAPSLTGRSRKMSIAGLISRPKSRWLHEGHVLSSGDDYALEEEPET